MAEYLFFDIDETLVSREHGLMKSAKEAIRRTREKGNLCFLCTGRQLGGLNHVKELEYDGIVFCNGGGIFYKGEIISLSPIPADVVERTMKLGEELEGTFGMMSSYRTFKNPREIDRMHTALLSDPRFDTFEEMMAGFGGGYLSEYHGQDIMKIDMGFRTVETMQEFLNRMDPALHCTAAAGTNVALGKKSGEITRIDVNKAAGIRRMLELIDGDMAHTYGFGDSANDVEMLRECAVGIAMGNASDDVKAYADYVTDTVENDGIYNAMEHYGLI